MFIFQGVREYSSPIGLEDKVKIDLVIVGSVAVSEKGESAHARLARQIPASRQVE